jgi:hypothetical protein
MCDKRENGRKFSTSAPTEEVVGAAREAVTTR